MLRSTLLLIALAIALVSAAGAAEEKYAHGVFVDKDRRIVVIDARIAPRKIDDPRYKEIYPIEVIACWAFPRGQKAHETVVTIEAKPSDVHKALESLGLTAGTPVVGEAKEAPKGPAVNILLEVPRPDDAPQRLAVEKVLVDPKTNKAMPKVQWRFTGSVLSKPDPNKDEKVYGADLTGTLIAIFPVTDQTVVQTNLTMKEEKYVKLETNKKLLPKEGTPVRLVLEVPAETPGK
jgi:hypothetical protein